MNLQNKKTVVIGMGKSGLAACELLKKMGAELCVFDENKEMSDSNKERFKDVTVYLGDLPDSVLGSLDCAVISPGIPLTKPLVLQLEEKNVPIIGEVELAYLMERGTVIGITGTNGKTTTTALTGDIIKAYKKSCFVVGNIGNPYTKEVEQTSEQSVTVAEISSFQLETIDTFCPDISAILNITPDHLDRHGSMENYIEAKFRITKNQSKDQFCVLNYEDEVLRERASGLNCRVGFFSSKRPLENGLYQNENHDIVDGATGEVLMNMRDSRIPGDKNCENIMAAILITREIGVPMETIVSAVKEFHAVEHRIEYVCTKHDVEYYNDSKGTNPDAAITGIQSMSRRTVLIGGGYDKSSEYDSWIQAFDGKVKKLLLLGQTKEKIAASAEKMGFLDYEFVDSLEAAVTRAAEIASPGDAVLLSPACASWDMFDSFEQRGKLFKEYANQLL